MKIEAVMACAELDAAASAGPSTAVSPLSLVSVRLTMMSF